MATALLRECAFSVGLFCAAAVGGGGHARHLAEGAVEGVDRRKAAFRREAGDAEGGGLLQKPLGAVDTVKSEKLLEMQTRRAVQGVGQVFFIVAEGGGKVGEGDGFGIVAGEIGDDLLVEKPVRRLPLLAEGETKHVGADEIEDAREGARRSSPRARKKRGMRSLEKTAQITVPSGKSYR